MKINKKIAVAGVAVSAFSVLAVAPTVNAVSLTQAKPGVKQLTAKNKIVNLVTQNNAAVDVTTDLNCADHTLMAKVTNKTDSKITPNVTFNKEKPSFPENGMPIEPGKSATYFWSFSGNNVLTDVNVHVDTYDDLKLSPTLNCTEPVSFRVSETSDSMVAGWLSNNSSFVSQTVYTRVNAGDIRVEQLKPGESRQIALPFNPLNPEAKSAYVAIGTDDGYQGTYTVDLEQIIQPLPR